MMISGKGFPMKCSLAVALLAVAMIGAAPASADSTDAEFVAFLESKSIPFDSPAKAVEEAQASCLLLEQGKPLIEVVQGLSGYQINYSEETAAYFVGAAAEAYCPAYAPS